MLLTLLAAAALAAEPPKKGAGHAAPAETMSAAPASEKRLLLTELWQRRIISSETDRYAPEDLALLERLREAERAGALAELRRTYAGNVNGLVATYKIPSVTGGRSSEGLRLTREGFDKWLFLRSQKALEYFQSKDVDAKWAFMLTDLSGKKLFEQTGLLTPAGDALYSRVALGLSAEWRLPDGTVAGNRPHRPQPPAPAEPEPALEIPIGPEHPSILDYLYQQSRGIRYAPTLRVTKLGKLTIVTEHDPRGEISGALMIVARPGAKPPALKEFRKQLPTMTPPEVVTLDEKMAALGSAAKKAGWRVDRDAVEKQLRELLKGRIAVVWALAGPVPAEPPPAAEAPAPAEAPKVSESSPTTKN